jgi:formylglycine-generating enzyme required for sulfatase activity
MRTLLFVLLSLSACTENRATPVDAGGAGGGDGVGTGDEGGGSGDDPGETGRPDDSGSGGGGDDSASPDDTGGGGDTGTEPRLVGETVAGVELVGVCAGTFQMGCVPGRDDPLRDCHGFFLPAREVTLTRDFLIGRTELTRSAWAGLMGGEPSTDDACVGDCPVETVTWHDAAAFTNALSTAAGLTVCYACTGATGGHACTPLWAPGRSLSSPYACTGFRLPTGAEYEDAARAGVDEAWPGHATDSDAVARTLSNAEGRAWPVGSLAPNAWGLVDLGGNVWEWTDDHADFYDPADTTDPFPGDAGEGWGRVYRGGSRGNGPENAQSCARFHAVPSFTHSSLGFRVVRSR